MMRLIGITAVLSLLAPPAEGQSGPPEVQERPFMLSRDRELETLIQQAEELLARNRPDAAAALLSRIQRTRPAGVVVPLDLDRSEGLLTRVRRTFSRLPREQAAALEEAVRSDARPLLERGLLRRDPELLAETAARFPGTRFAAQARDALAGLALERGRAAEAAAWYRRSLEEDPADGVAAAGLAIARALQGQAPAPLPAGTKVLFGGLEEDGEALLARLDALPPLLADPRPWPDFGGSGRLMAEPPPLMSLTWEQPLEGPDDPSQDSVLHPVTDGSRVFLCPGREALALDLFTGRRLWSYTVKQSTGPEAPRARFFRLRSDEAPAPPPAGLALAGTLAGGLFICPLQVGRLGTDSQFRQIRITTSFPVRRLHAFDASSGALVWRHSSPEGEALREMIGGLDVAGPPIGSGEHVFVPTVDYGQTVSAYVCCFEAATGRLLWRTRICSGQLQLNMFGNPTREYAASPLALHEGVLYGSTNLGVNFALEAHTGEVRWLGFYESSRPPDMAYQDHFRFRQEQEAPFGANAPLVLDAAVLFAPADSEAMIALDRMSGAPVWRLPARLTVAGSAFEIRYILGALGGEIYCQGNGVLAVNPERRRGRGLLGSALRIVLTPERLGTPGIPPSRLPRGGLAQATLFTINQLGGLCLWDLQGAASPIMRASRDLGGRFFGREAIRVGNLLAAPGVLLAVGNRLASAFLSLEHILSRAETELRQRPLDPELSLTLASVLLHRDQPGDLARAEEILEKALALPTASGERAGRIASTLRRVLLARVGTLLAQGESSQAEALARRAVAISPQGDAELEARLLLADLLDKAGKAEAWRAEAAAILEAHEFQEFKFQGADAPERVGPRLLVRLARSEPEDAAGAARALAWWRRLLEGFSADLVQGRKARDLAAEEIARLLARHGRGLYGPWEERARALLDRGRTTGEPELLRRIVTFFPNSLAAAEALRLLVDNAAAEGDLGLLLEEVRNAASGRGQPGLQHRLAEAALAAGNPWLARALFLRLAALPPGLLADFGPDAGRPLAEAAVRRCPTAPAPGEAALGRPPTRRHRFELPEIDGGTPRMLRPVTWGKADPADPLLFLSGERVWASRPDPEAGAEVLWEGVLPGPLRTSFPVLRFAGRAAFACRSSIALLDLQDGSPAGEFELPPGTFPKNFLARHGLLLSAVEIREQEALRIQALEPFTAALWGDLTVGSGPGGQILLVPGPELLHAVAWREEGDRRQWGKARLEITDIDPVTMEARRRTLSPDEALLPVDLPLDRSTCVATAEHLVLPLLIQGRSVLRAIPLVEGLPEWELELPPAEQILRLAVLQGPRLALLGVNGRQGVLRILEARTGAVERQILLGSQALLLHPSVEGDPWAMPPGPLLLALSGSNPRARTLHLCDVEKGTASTVILPGDGFTSGAPLAAPVLGPDLAALVLRLRPEGASASILETYVVDTSRGLLLARHPQTAAALANPELIAAGEGLLILSAGNMLSILEPEGR